jgi:hypothetical protein
MAVSIITQEDLENFKIDLLKEIKFLLGEKGGVGSKKWLKTGELVEKLGISQSKIQKLRLEGIFPYSRVGGLIFYDYEAIMKVFEKNKIKNVFNTPSV